MERLAELDALEVDVVETEDTRHTVEDPLSPHDRLRATPDRIPRDEVAQSDRFGATVLAGTAIDLVLEVANADPDVVIRDPDGSGQRVVRDPRSSPSEEREAGEAIVVTGVTVLGELQPELRGERAELLQPLLLRLPRVVHPEGGEHHDHGNDDEGKHGADREEHQNSTLGACRAAAASAASSSKNSSSLKPNMPAMMFYGKTLVASLKTLTERL